MPPTGPGAPPRFSTAHLLAAGEGLLAAVLAAGRAGARLALATAPQAHGIDGGRGGEAALQAAAAPRRPPAALLLQLLAGRRRRAHVDRPRRRVVLGSEAGLAEDVGGVAEAAAGAAHHQVLGVGQLPGAAAAAAAAARAGLAIQRGKGV